MQLNQLHFSLCTPSTILSLIDCWSTYRLSLTNLTADIVPFTFNRGISLRMSRLVRMIEDIFDINCGIWSLMDISFKGVSHLKCSFARIICNSIEKQIVLLGLLKLIPWKLANNSFCFKIEVNMLHLFVDVVNSSHQHLHLFPLRDHLRLKINCLFTMEWKIKSLRE